MEKKAMVWQLEGVLWLVTALLTGAILLPIFRNVPSFPFLIFNIAAVVIFFTLIRYIFLLRYTPFSRFTPIKLVFIFISIVIFVYLMDGLSTFQNTLDEEGTYSMVSHLAIEKQLPLSKYIRSEMIFFATGALIATLILPFRMIISIWRVRNRGTV